MGKRQLKSVAFLNTVCQTLDADRSLTLLEYADTMKISKWNAYELLKVAVNRNTAKYNQYLQRPNKSHQKPRPKAIIITTSKPENPSNNYDYSDFIEWIEKEIQKNLEVIENS